MNWIVTSAWLLGGIAQGYLLYRGEGFALGVWIVAVLATVAYWGSNGKKAQ